MLSAPDDSAPDKSESDKSAPEEQSPKLEKDAAARARNLKTRPRMERQVRERSTFMNATKTHMCGLVNFLKASIRILSPAQLGSRRAGSEKILQAIETWKNRGLLRVIAFVGILRAWVAL